MRTPSILLRSLLVCVSAMLGACASQAPSAMQQERLPSEFEDVAVELNSFAGGYLRNGVFLSATDIYEVGPGVNRRDVQRLLGMPTNSPSPEWWFYNINLPLEGLDDYLVCQYRVAFDGDVVEEAVWRRPQCKALHDGMLANASPANTGDQPQQITLSSDILFAFDSPELSEQGRNELTDVARVVLREVDLTRVDVVGHADRTGTTTYNDDLSRRRARTVGEFLASSGVPENMIFSEGRGSREPVVTCEGSRVTDELKRCLQPNRRVQITINGLR